MTSNRTPWTLSACLRQLRALAGFALVLPAAALADRERVDETRAVEPGGFVHIKVVRGDLDVVGWDRDEVHVEGLLDAKTRRFVFEVNGNDTLVDVQLPRRSGGNRGDGSNLTVRVPANSSVEISVVSTDTRVENVEGGLELGSVSGEVSIRNVRDRVDLSSVSGELEMRDVSGRTRATSVSGDIECYRCAGEGSYQTVSGGVVLRSAAEDLKLESVSGDIEVEAENLLAVSGHTISGDVDISGTLAESGIVEFDSVSGNIHLRLPDAADARFNINTGAGGSIRNRLTEHEPGRSRYARDQSLKFVTGEGSGEVVLSTASGDITLTD